MVFFMILFCVAHILVIVLVTLGIMIWLYNNKISQFCGFDFFMYMLMKWLLIP
ncbi:hypothetical protein HanRHA438_Chr13g0628061 [Helianthus annuus]|nr:hypothetical protein HanRHA438_Chr13g0628061 [Helianthus annuus]